MRVSLNPKVTVLMAVYNGLKYLPEAISSVLNQTYSNFEFIIIDDGSTDKSCEVIEDFALKDQRIRFYQQKNKGLARTLNAGIKIARGKYIARMDADDICVPSRLQDQLRTIETHDFGLIAGGVCWIDHKGTEIGKYKPTICPSEMRNLLREGTHIIHPTVIFRRKIVEKLGGYRPLFRYAQDYDLWLRMSEYTDLACTPKVVLKYRIHEKQVSVKSIESQSLAAVAASYAARCRLSTGVDPLKGLKEVSYKTLEARGLTPSSSYKQVIELIEQNGLNNVGRGDLKAARNIAESLMTMSWFQKFPNKIKGAKHTILLKYYIANHSYGKAVFHCAAALLYQPLRVIVKFVSVSMRINRRRQKRFEL